MVSVYNVSIFIIFVKCTVYLGIEGIVYIVAVDPPRKHTSGTAGEDGVHRAQTLGPGEIENPSRGFGWGFDSEFMGSDGGETAEGRVKGV